MGNQSLKTKSLEREKSLKRKKKNQRSPNDQSRKREKKNRRSLRSQSQMREKKNLMQKKPRKKLRKRKRKKEKREKSREKLPKEPENDDAIVDPVQVETVIEIDAITPISEPKSTSTKRAANKSGSRAIRWWQILYQISCFVISAILVNVILISLTKAGVIVPAFV